MNEEIASSGSSVGIAVQKASRVDLRHRNKRLLLHLIQTQYPISQAELARSSGLSPAAVSAILQPLIEDRSLIEEAKTTGAVGRKGSMLAFNPRVALTLGIVIEQEECEIALVDLSARVVDYTSEKYPCYSAAPTVVATIAEHLDAFLERNRINRSAIMGVGVAIPGLTDPKTGVVKVASNLGWRNVHLHALFEQALQCPTRIEHLGRAKVRAESLWGCGVGREHFICVEIGSGIGAGVIAGGRILKGATASAGEVGHNVIDGSGPRCACGLNGCWEVFCSSPAIRRRMAQHLAGDLGSTSALTPASSLADLDHAAGQGDPVARAVIDETAVYMARGLANLMWTFDPELIALSGSVIRDCPKVVDATRAVLHGLGAARSLDVPLMATIHEPYAGVVAASAIMSVRYLDRLARS